MRGRPGILIIHSGGIGDLLLALPAMRVFRRSFSLFPLEMMGRPERLSLVAHDLKARALHSIDQAGMAFFYAPEAQLPPRLVQFFSAFRAVLVFGKAGGEILGENLERAGVPRILRVPSFPPEKMKVHVSHFLVEALKGAGIEGEDSFQPLTLPEDSRRFAADFLARHGVGEGEPILAIHPGSGSPRKNWPLENFARVLAWARERARILLIAGPAEAGTREALEAWRKGGTLLADHLPLLSLAALLQKCRAYLGNDSGITHLAASLAVPTVALFGPTDPAVWGPLSPAVRVLRGNPAADFGPAPASSPGPRGGVNIVVEEVLPILGALIG